MRIVFRMRIILIAVGCLLFATSAEADWYWYVMKVVCGDNELRVIDYSAYNEEGEARRLDPNAIDVDKLSTWKRTDQDLRVPDKPLPHVTICRIPAGKYRVVLTNAGGGYSAPYPVINVQEISDPKHPKTLIKDISLEDSYKYKRYEIIFSSKYPKGNIIKEWPEVKP